MSSCGSGDWALAAADERDGHEDTDQGAAEDGPER